MKKLLFIGAMLSLSISSSFAGQSVDLDSPEFKKGMRIAAEQAAAMTDVHFACSKKGISSASRYGLSFSCDEAIEEALRVGVTEEEILEEINPVLTEKELEMQRFEQRLREAFHR